MKMKCLFPFVLIGILFVIRLPAQEEEQITLDWDIDTIFDEPLKELPSVEPDVKLPGATVMDLIKRRGFLFDAAYEFITGFAPGWYRRPWDHDWGRGDYYLDRFIRLRGSFGIDAQISSVFRTKSTIYFEIPNFRFVLGDFFFDYIINDAVFIRGGKYNLSWGISPNYGFTNLLSRVPKDGRSGDSFIFRADIPIGRGGIQALTMTRVDLMNNPTLPKIDDFGFGGKFNLVFRWADFDMGLFYQDSMALRAFFSIKTTILGTELYNEWLSAVDVNEPLNMTGAVNIGFARDFWDGKFSVNGELFYNAEKDAYWYHPETNIREAGKSPFIEGFNMALNFLYKPWKKGNPRLLLGALYAPMEKSAQLIPGFRLSPLPHIEFYFAVPMVLGSDEGYYYRNTVNKAANNKNAPLPFTAIFMVTLKGSVQFGHYY